MANLSSNVMDGRRGIQDTSLLKKSPMIFPYLEEREAEELVLSRHHRSGITVRFKPPSDPSPILPVGELLRGARILY